MVVVLVGYMGSGKSTVAQNLSKILNYEYADLDDVIAKNQRMTIEKIFAEKGEIFFRKLESELLKKILDIQKNLVLALGGGTPCYGDNMQLITNANQTFSVYLKSDIKTLVERLMAEKDQRPLLSHLQTDTELHEFVAKHLFERKNFYALSDITIETNGKSVQEITEEIIANLF